MLLNLIEQQRVSHEQEMKALKDGRKKRAKGSSTVKLPKPTLQKLTPTDNVEHISWPLLRGSWHSRNGHGRVGGANRRAIYLLVRQWPPMLLSSQMMQLYTKR